MAIQNKIKELRIKHGWTQETMAEKMNISPNSYSRLERGKGKLDWDKLQQVADIFKVDLVQLIGAEKNGLIIQQTVSFQNENESYTIQDNSKNYGLNQDLATELEKRDLTIAHQKEMLAQKTEMIAQKERENQVLQALVASLQAQLENK